MNPTVRRVENAVVPTNGDGGALQGADEWSPPVARRKDGLTVTSRKRLGADPGVLLSWEANAARWADGFRLMGFRSATGFAPEQRPADPAAHGQMFLEETSDGRVEDRLPEGTYFYTFVLHRRWCLGLFEDVSVVRFSETIPSARTAIGRIEDQLKLEQLKEDCELRGIKGQVARNEAMIAMLRSTQKLAAATTQEKADDSMEARVRRDVEAETREPFRRALTRIERARTLADLQQRLRSDPVWATLDEARRAQMLKDIADDLDADEGLLKP